MGTTGSTVLLCRVTNQTIVCSRTGHERGRERRSHIDPREHQQLITQIYVPIVHCLCAERDPLARAGHSMEATGWPIRLGPAGGPAVAARRRENDGTTTTTTGGDKRRTLSEDRSARIEEGNARSRGTERADHRRAAPPATSVVCLLPSRSSLLARPRTRVIIIESYLPDIRNTLYPSVPMMDVFNTIVRRVTAVNI